MWILCACLSSVCAGATAILSKLGVKKADSIVQGQVSVVVPIDKLSILITVIFSVIVLKEKLNAKTVIGLALLTAGTACTAIFA